jgi:hypothetical protein
MQGRKRWAGVALAAAALTIALVPGASALAANSSGTEATVAADVRSPAAYSTADAAPIITTRQVSAAEARQFGQQRDAVTEGVVPANPKPAAGSAEATAATTDATTEAANVCWSNRATLSKGTYPYNRTLIVFTYWCAYVGGAITYRSTNVSWSTGPLCSNTGTNQYRISGGVGYSWVKIHTEAWFACDTPWWFKLHDSIWMNLVYNSWGTVAAPEWG